MTKTLRTSLALTIAAAVALALAASPALAQKPAAKKAACWKVLINDWYDGTINGRYSISCYRSALKHIRSSPDLRGYTSAYEEINAALQRRLVEIANQKKSRGKGKPSVVAAGKSGGDQGSAAPPTSSGGGPKGKGPRIGSSPNPVKPPTPQPGRTSGRHGGGRAAAQTKPPTHPGSPTPPSAAPNPGEGTYGREPAGSPSNQLAQVLGPKDATSVPIPLLVLAGVALLLMAAGAAGLLARRTQGKRVPVRVRPAPPARGN